MEDKPEEHGRRIALTDAQRENVRKMLARFGGQIDAKDDKAPVEEEEEEVDEVQNKTQEDLFMGVVSGTTIEWHDLTPESKKYSFVREICCQFEPYLWSRNELTPAGFKRICSMIGIEPNNTSASLITCAVEQADPIMMVHIQVESKKNGNIVVERLRFIT
jgi:hypothetical protein